jgi:hypothetical protein
VKSIAIAKKIDPKKPTIVFSNFYSANEIIKSGFLMFKGDGDEIVKFNFLTESNKTPLNFDVLSISIFSPKIEEGKSDFDINGVPHLDFMCPSYEKAIKAGEGDMSFNEYSKYIIAKIRSEKNRLYDFINSLERRTAFVCETDLFYEKALVSGIIFNALKDSKYITDRVNILLVSLGSDSKFFYKDKQKGHDELRENVMSLFSSKTRQEDASQFMVKILIYEGQERNKLESLKKQNPATAYSRGYSLTTTVDTVTGTPLAYEVDSNMDHLFRVVNIGQAGYLGEMGRIAPAPETEDDIFSDDEPPF